MPPRSKTAIVALKFRLREDLRRRVEAEAKKHGHSLNRELVRRVELSFEHEAQANMQAMVEAIARQLGVKKALADPAIRRRGTLGGGAPEAEGEKK